MNRLADIRLVYESILQHLWKVSSAFKFSVVRSAFVVVVKLLVASLPYVIAAESDR